MKNLTIVWVNKFHALPAFLSLEETVKAALGYWTHSLCLGANQVSVAFLKHSVLSIFYISYPKSKNISKLEAAVLQISHSCTDLWSLLGY